MSKIYLVYLLEYTLFIVPVEHLIVIAVIANSKVLCFYVDKLSTQYPYIFQYTNRSVSRMQLIIALNKDNYVFVFVMLQNRTKSLNL